MLAKDAPAPSHRNNFDFLRLVFATFVVTGHSYFLSGLPEHDTLWQFSHGQEKFSKFGLWGFFSISGYLIVNSLLRSASLPEYYFKRMIRVFPALWVMIGLTLLGGYFFYDHHPEAYFTNHSGHLYLLNLVLRLHTSVTGLFSANPVPNEMNGSLWTVPYEVFFYLLVTPLFFIRHQLAWLRGVLVATFAGLLALQFTGQVYFPTFELGLLGDQIIFLGLFFTAGAVLAVFPAWFRTARGRTITVAVTGGLLVATLSVGGYTATRFLLVPLFVVALGESNYPVLSWIRRYGDISYSVYIWGWPLQQALVHVLHPAQPLLSWLSVLSAWGVGAASWHLIEKQALHLKLRRVRLILLPAQTTERPPVVATPLRSLPASPTLSSLARQPVAQQ